jgi:hypothetical protein
MTMTMNILCLTYITTCSTNLECLDTAILVPIFSFSGIAESATDLLASDVSDSCQSGQTNCLLLVTAMRL